MLLYAIMLIYMLLLMQSNPGRADWAKSTCRIIIEGHEFEECRKKVSDYQLFYKDCLYDTCGSVTRRSICIYVVSRSDVYTDRGVLFFNVGIY